MTDVYGYNKKVESAGIMTSEFASLNIGSAVGLLQGCQGSYGRNVTAMFEAGSSTMYLTNGNAQGQLTANCAVGKKGFLSSISSALGNCGRIEAMSVNLLSGGRCSAAGTGGFTFEGGVINNIQFSFATGTEAVTEGFTMIIPAMGKK
jgi:hypothetical protein